MKNFQGMKFEDNTDSVQTYTAGQQVPLYFNIRAPHSGYANVSIIDTTSNSMIAANLSAWDEYALTSIPAKTEWTVRFFFFPSHLLPSSTYIFFYFSTELHNHHPLRHRNPMLNGRQMCNSNALECPSSRRSDISELY